MIRSLFQIEPLLPLIAADKLILTPNNRLRNQIKLAYQAHLGNQVVASPRVYSFSEWQQLLWQDLQSQVHPSSLVCIANNLQLDYLWRQVIAESDLQTTATSTLLEQRALARQARDAHANLLAWQQHIDQLSCDPEITQWCQALEQKLYQQNLITSEHMQQRLVSALQGGILKNEADIYLHSFIDISPLAQTLLQAAGKNIISLAKQANKTSTLTKTRAENIEQEIAAASQWAWRVLQTNPNATVGIIAPQLARDRNVIERVLTTTFESHTLDPTNPRSALPFNISAAQSLGQTPLVAGTLQLLSLNLKQLPIQDMYGILHSPFFGQRQLELPLRNFILTELKGQATFTTNVNQIGQIAQQFCDQQASDNDNLASWQQFSKNLQQFIASTRQHSPSVKPSQWTAIFCDQLQQLGWPGERRIDSVEYQQISHWYTALENFAGLDNQVGTITLETALGLVKDACQNLPFQTETRDTPIHVLGAFEAVGLHFSHCWVLGINDKEWPAPLQANTLLPKQLQAQLNMPKSSLTREIDIAKQLIEHFSKSAEVVIASHAVTVGNAQTNASHLIRHLEEKELEEVVSANNIGLEAINHQLIEQQHLEWVDCSKGPPLVTSAEAPATGGQKLFALQAQCPFNAFAELRLVAKAPEQPQLGYGPKEKGIILHNALASVWEKLRTKHALMTTDEQKLLELITNAVVGCCTQLSKPDAALLGEYYYQLEQQRLINLLLRWFAWERQRPDFTVIATEQKLTTEFGGIHLRMRIDRVDQLDNGAILLIDYKTSPHTTTTWLQERPSEPQLPLYSLCYEEPVAGISFATVSNDELGFRGIADNSDSINIDGIKSTQSVKIDNWETLRKLFDDRLKLLARELVNGDCRVMFQNSYQPSRDPLAPLNRVFEQDFINYCWRQQF